MIDDLRTDALHEALSTAEIDDLTLLALFVLAGSGDNVAIRTGDTSIGLGYRAHDTIAAPVVENGVLVRDPETIQAGARRMLRSMPLLRQTWQCKHRPARAHRR